MNNEKKEEKYIFEEYSNFSSSSYIITGNVFDKNISFDYGIDKMSFFENTENMNQIELLGV
jgi:hypothetical protein